MRVLLVRVPLEACDLMQYSTFSYFAEPAGLNYIAEAAEKRAHKVHIHDMYLDPDPARLMDAISIYGPDIVGLSSLIIGYDNVALLSGMVKTVYPKIKIVVGGPCTFMPPAVMMKDNPNIDYVIKGEGEAAFASLCDALEQCAWSEIRKIDGLSYREADHVIENPKRRFINAETLSFPVNRYNSYKEYLHGSIITTVMGEPPIVFMETSRGCQFSCNFCGVWEPYRKRDPEKVVDELALLNVRHNVKRVIFADYSFTTDQKHVEQICSLILDRGLKIEWGCDTRVDCVSLPLLKLMKRAGCRIIFYGVESFSQKTLDALNKGTNVVAIKEALKNTRKAKIQSLAYMMLGAPGETRGMVLKNSKMLHQCGVDYALWGVVRLFCGTPLFERAVKAGLIQRDEGQRDCMSGNIDQIPVFSDTLSYAEMKVLEMQVIKRFYFRFGYVFKRITGIRDLEELLRLAKQIRYLLFDKVLRFC